MHRRLATAVALGAVAALSASAHAGLPASYPKPGCFDIVDDKGDAHFYNQPSAPADADMDILGVAFQTTPTLLRAVAKIDALAAGPSTTDGHRYTLDFTFNNHVFSAAASSYKSGTGGLRDALATTGQAGHVVQLGVDVPALTSPAVDKGFKESGLKVTFDTANSYVVFELPIADIVKYGGAPFAKGAVLSAVDVKSATDTYYVSSQSDTTAAKNATTGDGRYVVGTSKCFAPIKK